MNIFRVREKFNAFLVYIFGVCAILVDSCFLTWNITPKHRRFGNMVMFWAKNGFVKKILQSWKLLLKKRTISWDIMFFAMMHRFLDSISL